MRRGPFCTAKTGGSVPLSQSGASLAARGLPLRLPARSPYTPKPPPPRNSCAVAGVLAAIFVYGAECRMLYENAFGAAGALLRKCLFELVFANGTHPFFLRFIPYFTFRKLRFVSAFIWTGSGGKPLPVQIKAPRSRAARRRFASSGGSGARGGEEIKKRETLVNGTFLAIVQEEKSAATGRRKRGGPGSRSAAGPPLSSERGPFTR